MSIESSLSVPNLTTALTGPLQLVESLFIEQQAMIETWFKEQWQKTPPPLMGSIDLRNAGFKLAPVDTNLFPAGFNNLNPDFLPLCVQTMHATLTTYYPQASRILLVTESHTRNPFYLESVANLKHIIENAGYELRLTQLDLENSKPLSLQTASEKELIFHRVTRNQQQLQCKDFIPDLILLNNDLSEGNPQILKDLAQPIIPNLRLGWSTRLKSNHFYHYEQICEELAGRLKTDPWLMSPVFRNCGDVDFMTRGGEECLIYHSKQLLQEIQNKYDEYKIPTKPFIFIKADSGTYGMGIMTIKNIDEIATLNRKQRTRMSTTKGKQKITKVILQEGIPTYETLGQDKKVAEPVIYTLGSSVVGGFYRVHQEKGIDENLNAPGMTFEPLAFADCDPLLKPIDYTLHPTYNRFYSYGVLARAAILAAAREHQKLS